MPVSFSHNHPEYQQKDSPARCCTSSLNPRFLILNPKDILQNYIGMAGLLMGVRGVHIPTQEKRYPVLDMRPLCSL